MWRKGERVHGGACPFCRPDPSRVRLSSEFALAIEDGYPVNPGHLLVVPRRHVADWFETTGDERSAILRLLHEARTKLDEELHPDGYNIGVNVGEAAGQTVGHVHVHLIPRFRGDVDDPTGGVRFVIPARGDYHRPGRIPRICPPDDDSRC